MNQGLKKVLFVITVTLVVAITFCWAWLSFGKLDQTKQKVFSILPFPAATVDGQAISMKSFIERYEIAENFYGINANNEQPDLKNKVLQQLIEEAKVRAVASEKSVLATDGQIDAEFIRRQNQVGKSNFSKLLADEKINEEIYKKYLVRSDVTAANLTSWFYSQRKLNPESYMASDQILQQLKAGVNFNDLVNKYSQDRQSSQIGGDNGPSRLDETLPEVQNAIKDLKPGQPMVIGTRYGVTVVKSQAAAEGKVHLYYIFLGGNDFTAWYNEQTQNIPVKIFVKI